MKVFLKYIALYLYFISTHVLLHLLFGDGYPYHFDTPFFQLNPQIKKSLWNGGLIKANAKCQQFLYKLDYEILSACVEKLGLWSQKLLE